MTRLKPAADRFRAWCVDAALPFWGNTAADPDGGYFEDLTLEGQPRRDQIRRMRVQPRQAYVYAHAAKLGWCKNAQVLSDHGYQYMLDRAAIGDPLGKADFSGFIHRLNPDGSVANGLHDTYDHAFVLLASAWRIDAFRDETARQVVDTTLDWMASTLSHEDGSFEEGVPAGLPRRQNPHMHLFEAFMALYRATGEARHLAHARQIFDLFRTRFFDPSHGGVVREFFTTDWGLDPDRGDEVEPGHMMEWIWLLDQYQDLTGEDVSAWLMPLYRNAEALGLDQSSGFLLDTVSLNPDKERPRTRRTWVQTEYIRASLVLARRGEPKMVEKAAELIDRLFETYLATPVPGGYIDQFGPDGKAVSTAMPTSTLYHFISAAAEADQTARVLG